MNTLDAPPENVLTTFSQLIENTRQTLPSPSQHLALVDGNPSLIEKLFSVGMDDYINYPIIPAEIYRRLSYSLNFQSHSAVCPTHSLTTQNKISTERAIKTAEFLSTNLAAEISLAQLSKQLLTNRSTLSNEFKSHFGMTIFAWLREQRLLKGAEMLESGELSVTRISEEVGFHNSHNFSSAFKKRFHISPLRYKKMAGHSAIHKNMQPVEVENTKSARQEASPED